METEQDSSRRGSLPIVLATFCLLAVTYVLSSGPLRIGFEKIDFAYETHEKVFAPLLWARDNTAAKSVVDWYWGLFENDPNIEARSTEVLEHEDVEGLDKWLLSPKVRAINRALDVD